MVDLATLRGVCPALSAVPALLYFHENQFFYPPSEHQVNHLEPQMVTLYGALSAQSLVFNSEFNRSSFISGVESLLAKLPDYTPANLGHLLRTKSCVIPVPLEPVMAHTVEQTPCNLTAFNVVWNHRWEYDKGPELLLAALERLPQELPLKVHILGQQFRAQPEAFEKIRGVLLERGWLGTWGFESDRCRYEQILAGSQLAISTAHHDFQGLSILEAVARGCIPVVPDRLAYKEWFDAQFRYSGQEEPGALAAMVMQRFEQWRNQGLPAPPSMRWMLWESLAPQYEQIFKALFKVGPR